VNHWLSKLRQPTNSLLVIVGDFDPTTALAAAEKQLGSWGANATPGAPPPDPPFRADLAGPEDRIVYANQPGSAHATLEFECLLPKTSADDWAARLLFEDGVSGAVLDQFRERMGSTYSVAPRLIALRGGTTALRLQTDIDYRLLPVALRWLQQNVAGAGEGFVGRERLEGIKAETIRRVEIDGATSLDWAEKLVRTWTRGWPLDLRDRLPAGIAAVSADELDRIADHCRANGVIGLLGDEPRLRRAWQAAQ
jgi:hypothetical protein